MMRIIEDREDWKGSKYKFPYKNNGRKYFGETGIGKEMKELNFRKGKEYLFPQSRKKGRSEVGKYIQRIAFTSTLKKKR